MKHTMAELEVKALACLRKHHPTPLRCGTLGDYIFAEHIAETGRHIGSAPFARITGKIMARLKLKGLAFVTSRGKCWGWVMSQDGLRDDTRT